MIFFKSIEHYPEAFESGFLTLEARLIFIKMRETFVEALILYYLNSEYHIQIENNVFSYMIGGVFY